RSADPLELSCSFRCLRQTRYRYEFPRSHLDRLIHPPVSAEHPQIARDFRSGSRGLARVIGELHGRASICLCDFADERDGGEAVIGLGRAALEIVGEIGAPAEAHAYPPGKVAVGLLD